MFELRLLSRPRIKLDGEAVTDFVSDKALGLLCYLALNEGPYSREILAGLLWGEMTEERARANLRVALHNLRQLLPDYFDVTRKTVALKHEQAIWLDVAEFEEAAKQKDQLAALRRAADLYHSELLAGVTINGGPGFEDWLTQERERLRLTLLGVLESLVARYMSEHEWQAATDVARRLVVLEPWRESSHRQLMLLLARQGEYGLALAQYGKCRRELDEALGVQPMPETEALHVRIRRLRTRSRHNLPESPGPFVGREQELAQLAAFLASDDVRLISIVGLSGAGKTWLARKAASKQINAFLDGVFMVSLADLPSTDFLVSAIADALDINITSKANAEAQLLDFLRNRELLLVLDNFEHLLPDVSLLYAILSAAPFVKLLVTSRESLQMQVETLLPLSGLTLPQNFPTDQWEKADSVALFLARVRQLLPAFSPTGHERRAITRICEMVEGLPLGLELAAAWADALPLNQIAAETEQNLDFLKRPVGDGSVRHDSIYAAFATSWQRLEDSTQAVLAMLSVFRGGFAYEAAHAVSGADVSLLAHLVRKSLVEFQRAEERYRLHALLRQFAAQKLTLDRGALMEAHNRHMRYFLALVEKFDDAYRRTKQPEWLDRLSVEHDNIRASLEWALEREELEIVGRIGGALGVFWGIRGYLKEGHGWLAEVLAQRHKVSNYTLGKMFFALGWLAFEGGHYGMAENYYTSSYDLLQEVGTTARIAEVLSCLGHTAQQQANYDRAATLCEESLSLYRQLNDNSGVALILNRLGRIAELRGDFPRAVTLLKESLALRQTYGDERGMASTLNALAEIARYQEQYQRAASLYEESLAICIRLGDKRCIAGVRHNLGHVALHLDDYARATTLFKDSLLIYSELENMEGVALCLAGLGGAFGVQGELERAVHLLSKSEALFKSNQVVLAAADRSAYEHYLAVVRAQIDDAEFEMVWARGQNLPLEAALQYALT